MHSDTFIELLTAPLLTKSAQQVHVSNKNKNFDDIISRDTVHWTADVFVYLYQWIYSCWIAGQFTSNFQSRACLTMPSLSGITFYRNTQGHFGPLIIFACWATVPSSSFWSKFVWHFAPESLRPRLRSFGPLSFFKERKALLASTIIFFEDTSC